jgi:hypothetical protein
MKKVVLNTFLVFVILPVVFSQTFEKRIKQEGFLQKPNIKQDKNGNFAMTINRFNDVESYCTLYRMAEDGIMTDSVNIEFSVLDFTINNDNNILVFVYDRKEETTRKFITFLFDEHLRLIHSDTLLNQPFYVSTSAYFTSMGSKFVIGGNAWVDENGMENYYYFGWFDQSGNFIDSLKFISNDHLRGFVFNVTSKKDYFFMNALYDLNVILDINFSIIDTIEFENNFSLYHKMFWLNDTTTFISGLAHQNTNWIDMKVIKTDENFNELDEKEVFRLNKVTYLGIISNLVQVADGFLLIGTEGYIISPGYFFADSSKIHIVKYNFDLKYQWEKYYGGDAYYTVYSVTGTDDNGCIIASSRYSQYENNFDWDVYLIRIDSLGNFSTSSTTDFQIIPVSIFPNPGQNQIYLTLTENSNGIFKLYNIEGKLVYSQIYSGTQATFDLPVLPKGMYLYELIEENGNLVRGKWVRE